MFFALATASHALAQGLIALSAGLLGRAVTGGVDPDFRHTLVSLPGLGALFESPANHDWFNEPRSVAPEPLIEHSTLGFAFDNPILTLCYVGLVATVVKALSATFLAAGEAQFAARAGAKLRTRLAASLLDAGALESAPRVLATLAVRIRDVEQALVKGILCGIRATAQLVPLFAALIAVSASLASFALLGLLPFGLALGLLRSRFRRASDRAQRLVEHLHVETDELIRQLDLWRTYGARQRIERALEKSTHEAARAASRVEAARAGLSGLNEVLAALVLLLLLSFAGRLGLSTLNGDFVAFAAVFFMMYRPLRDVGDARAFRIRGATALAVLGEVVDPRGKTSPLIEAPRTFLGLPPQKLTVHRLGAQGFGPQTSFELLPGQILCLLGPTGSGKTTLLRCLLGLTPTRGELSYGSTCLTGVPAGPAFRPFAWVPQDAPLITGSVVDNVMLCGGNLEQAQAALKAVGALHLLDEMVGATFGSRTLSGGERRLVALARALSSQLPVLLLDEPTEGLDPDASQAVLDALQRLRGSRSILIVSHRAELQATADVSVEIGRGPAPNSEPCGFKTAPEAHSGELSTPSV